MAKEKCGRKAGVPTPFPPCKDTRPCCFRDAKGLCTILISTYRVDGKCPYCKESYAVPMLRHATRRQRPESAARTVDKYLNLLAVREEEPTCIHYLGTEKRLCRCTSNKSCMNCRSYCANRAARTAAVAKLLTDIDEERRYLRREVFALQYKAKLDAKYVRIGKAIEKFRGKRGTQHE